jgi:hypothetical protein
MLEIKIINSINNAPIDKSIIKRGESLSLKINNIKNRE